ncbi:MAG: ribosome silencing factor [Verrucomicrobiota bacterium]
MTDPLAEKPPIDPRDHARMRACLKALDDRKAEHLTMLDVRGQSTVTDYMILATGNSQPHLRALRVAAEEAFKESGSEILGTDNVPESGWVVVDGFDIMIHLFTQEMREYYRLEALWKDAEELPVDLDGAA